MPIIESLVGDSFATGFRFTFRFLNVVTSNRRDMRPVEPLYGMIELGWTLLTLNLVLLLYNVLISLKELLYFPCGGIFLKISNKYRNLVSFMFYGMSYHKHCLYSAFF